MTPRELEQVVVKAIVVILALIAVGALIAYALSTNASHY